MATVAVSAKVIAPAFGVPHSVASRGMRALREHDEALMPEGRPGPYGGAHVSAEHLAHALLMLGVPTREPMTEAHTWTVQYANFVPVAEWRINHGGGGMVERAVDTWHAEPARRELGGGSLRDALAWLIRSIGSDDPELRERMHRTAPRVAITAAPQPMVSILSTSLEDGMTTIVTEFAEPRQGEMFPAENTALLTRQTHVPFAALKVLAALCADTEAQRKPTPTPTPAPALPFSDPAPTNAGPEMESADPLPKGPALIRDHDRDSQKSDQMPVRGREEARGVCAKTQPLCESDEWSTPSFFEVLNHDRPYFPAFAVGA